MTARLATRPARLRTGYCYAECDRAALEATTHWSWRKIRRLLGELVALEVVVEVGPDAYIVDSDRLAQHLQFGGANIDRSRRWSEALSYAYASRILTANQKLMLAALTAWAMLADGIGTDRPIPDDVPARLIWR